MNAGDRQLSAVFLIICATTPVVIQWIHDMAGCYHKASQAFPVFLLVKFVGVVSDGRRYECVIALRFWRLLLQTD